MITLSQITTDAPIVMVRCTAPGSPEATDMDSTLLVGYFSYKDGVIKSLDDNEYSLDDEYVRATITKTKDYDKILVLTYEAEWVDSKEEV